MDSPAILYSFRRCPYAMRARLALAISGWQVEMREVALRDKPADMLAASPKATVPVMVLGNGRVIDQSLDIMRLALDRNDPENWRAGDDTALIADFDGPFKHHLDRYKYPERHGSDPLVHRMAGVDHLAALDARLAAHGQLCGPARSLADMAIFPFVRQFAAVEPEWFGSLPLPRLHRWLDGHVGSTLFAKIMLRFATWRAGDAPVMMRWDGIEK
jgi:glutathione S-transferase